jgi:predicted AAA+ superfamily ATPase
MIEVKIHPLSFSEFLRMKNENFFNKIHNKTWVAANMGIINSLFEEYLKKGQFPEIIKEKLSTEDAEKYLLSIEDKIIRQDLVKAFPVNYPEILAMIFEIIKRGVGQRIEYQKIALEAGIDQRTIMKYFGFLQYGFLINLCYNWGARKPVRPLRRVKKGYLTSTNFSKNADTPLLVENYVYNYLSSQYEDVYFQKEPEIDFLVNTDNNEICLLEIKYQNQIRKEDSKNILSFKSKKPINKFLITKTDLAKKDEVCYLPASLIEFHQYF